ncbi:hypothetical protein [Mesorhizobium sp. 1B3]|uniref:hypothetical protein n=1 Tax=Mesorhizobium sp. 1B3 TaxID=3243599 RepID=UPI003D967C29
MPEVFCLDSNAEETLTFLAKMRENLLSRAVQRVDRKGRKGARGKPISRYYDLATMRYISPTAGLILAALYHRAKSITGQKLHTINEHLWAPEVRRTLRSVGFHEFLDMQKPALDGGLTSPVIIQKFTSGSQADGKPVGKLQEALTKLLPDELGEKLLAAEPYGGMFEAILNSHSWAYPADHDWDYPPLRNWWLTGAVDTATGRVTVAVFDQGISIPVSLPHWKHWGKVEERAKKILARLRLTEPIEHFSNDGYAIRLAMTIAKSQTNLPQHGKGLHTMVEVAQRARHGRLRIISRNGEYVWETGKRPQMLAYGNPIGGTLVEWTLDL